MFANGASKTRPQRHLVLVLSPIALRLLIKLVRVCSLPSRRLLTTQVSVGFPELSVMSGIILGLLRAPFAQRLAGASARKFGLARTPAPHPFPGLCALLFDRHVLVSLEDGAALVAYPRVLVNHVPELEWPDRGEVSQNRVPKGLRRHYGPEGVVKMLRIFQVGKPLVQERILGIPSLPAVLRVKVDKQFGGITRHPHAR